MKIPVHLTLLLVIYAALAGGTKATAEEIKTVHVETPAPPPEWAVWQRFLLERMEDAALEFVERYTREDGTLIWRDEWPGMDGSDDGYESFHNFPLYYALGGPEKIHSLSRKLWDGVTRQFTGYGLVHNEFDAYYDWMHHGESYVYFYSFGLADPTVKKERDRALKFAGMYMGEDPDAPNWDAELKLIRSPINGSRGPRFVNSAEDWVTHRPILAKYPLPFDDIPNVTESAAWDDDEKFPFILEALNSRMMRGDVPLNLTATSLILNAYMYTGDEKYKQWIVDYVKAWMERTERNGGIIPDNVGLTGKIGEFMDGKWWGGYYGWRWPHGFFNILEATTIGATNAFLVTQDASFFELPRSQVDLVTRQGRMEDGQFIVPYKYKDDGWYQYRALDPKCLINLWYISEKEEDWQRVTKHQDPSQWHTLPYKKIKGDDSNERAWIGYLQGKNPEFPVKVLKQNYAESLRRLQEMRNDKTTVDEQDVHHWQQFNPVITEGLVQLTLGGPGYIYHGGLLHTRVRYFDPKYRRPGLPEDVAALVSKIDSEGITLTLANVHPSKARDVMVQAGAYGEHQFTSVTHAGKKVDVRHKHLRVRVHPGSVGTLEIKMQRFADMPSYAAPWHEDGKVPVVEYASENDRAERVSVSAKGAETDRLVKSARQLREQHHRDPHRPLYHFLPAEGAVAPADPHGCIFWKGKYHLFYGVPLDGVGCWGHASSIDLVHWTHHPTALSVGPGDPEQHVYAGGAFINKEGIPTMIYHGVKAGTCIATSQDDNLDEWTKHPANPVIPIPKEGDPLKDEIHVWDTCAWVEGDTYYSLSGNLFNPWAPHAPKTDGDIAFLFKSKDMVHWDYVHPFYKSERRWTFADEDCSCPDFFPLGDKHVLTFISHSRGLQYYIGDFRDEKFYPETHHRMNWPGGPVFAQESLLDDKGRRILWAWVTESYSSEAHRASGWGGVMTVPRVLSLDGEGRLLIEPVEELNVLRLHHRKRDPFTLVDGKELDLEEVRGDSLELGLEVDMKDARTFVIKVRCSPDSEEETPITFDAVDKEIRIDTTRSSLRKDIKQPWPHPLTAYWDYGESKEDVRVQRAPFELAPGEKLSLRIYLDRSILEVFANGRQCITQRIYPDRADSLGVVLSCSGGDTRVSLDAWDMAPANAW